MQNENLETIRLLVDAVSGSIGGIAGKLELLLKASDRTEAGVSGIADIRRDIVEIKQTIAAIQTNIESVQHSVKATSKLAELLRKPLVIVLLIVAVLVALSELKDGVGVVKEYFAPATKGEAK